jgi:hypothetical protein
LDENNRVIPGVKLEFDTCMSITEKDVYNNLRIYFDRFIIFTSGSTIIIKDMGLKSQHIIYKKGLLRNITAMSPFSIEKGVPGSQERTRLVGLAIGESSLTEKGSISIHVHVPEENSWTTLSTPEIRGEVRRLDVKFEKKQIVALVMAAGGAATHPVVYVWNYSKDKLIAHIELKFNVENVCFHPVKLKRVPSLHPSFCSSVTAI